MMTTLAFNELTSIMKRQRITRTKKSFLAIECKAMAIKTALRDRISYWIATGGRILKIFPHIPPLYPRGQLGKGQHGMGIMLNCAVKNNKNINFKTLPLARNFKL